MSEPDDLQFLSAQNIYVCSNCQSHQFTGKYGIAYLVNKAFNVSHGPAEVVILITGKHTTSEAKCRGCGAYVGWKYLDAENASNFYKINKYVIEKEVLKTIEYYKED